MPILNCRLDETILTSDDIAVTLVDIRGSQVDVVIKAPRDIAIKREELLERGTEDA